jgi:hypothetical protein
LKGKLAQWGASIKGTVPEKRFRIPFNPTPAQVEKAGYTYEDITIWKDIVRALNMESEIPVELKYFLGITNKLGLFRIDNKALREVHRCAPKKEELGWQPVTVFQDAVSGPKVVMHIFLTDANSILSTSSILPVLEM